MDLSNLKAKKEALFSALKDGGYSKKTMMDITSCYNVLMKYGASKDYASYEDFYTFFIVPNYSPSSAKDKKGCLATLWYFDKNGTLPTPCVPKGFMPRDTYGLLCDEFKRVVDNYRRGKRERRNLENTIKGRTYSLKKFLLACQDAGCKKISDITEDIVRDYYTNENLQSIEVTSVIRDALSYSSEEIQGCDVVSSYLPKKKMTRKPYDFLSPSESKALQAVIESPDNGLSLRNKAIMTIVFYLGLRRGDLAALKLKDVDFQKDKISFVQSKTNVRQELPLRPVVGNAIYEYIVKERPRCNHEHLFLIDDGKNVRPITAWAIYDIAEIVFEKAGVRTDGRRRGVHVFRHNLATSLIKEGCDALEVTSVMGHVSPSSLEVYLSADENLLRACALSIEEYPLYNDIFKHCKP